jgi:hypothetical protein
MAKVAEGIARVADGIASDRRERSKLATEIKLMTSRRHREVRSMLGSMKETRIKETDEQAAEAKKMNSARHSQVHSMIRAMRMSRGREAAILIKARRSEMRNLLAQFRGVRVMRRQQFQKLAAAQRDRAAAFMRHLTSSVAALRDSFVKEGRERAMAMRKCLAAYAADRHEAVLIWHGNSHHMLVAQGAGASGRRESVAVQVASPAPHTPATPAQALDMSARSAERPAAAWSAKGSNQRHGKDSK